MSDAAMSGCGIAFVPEDDVRPRLASGALAQGPDDWSLSLAGYRLHDPSRHHYSTAFRIAAQVPRRRGTPGPDPAPSS